MIREFMRIFHATDYSETSELAFIHGLKLALAFKGEFHILHTEEDIADHSFQKFPKVRETLSRWNILPAHATENDFSELRLSVRKTLAKDPDPVRAILNYLQHQPADLLVLATHPRKGLSKLLHKSVSQSVACATRSLTLFLPEGADGFVNPSDGSLSLNNVLFPIDIHPPPQFAIEAAIKLSDLLDCSNIKGTMLHVGALNSDLLSDIPNHYRWKWDMQHPQGDIVSQIIGHANKLEVELIVMATEGRHSFLDGLRGSITERVIAEAPCPVLTVNIGAH